ncbi:MAG: hypothetical protein ACQUYJ_13650 [Ferruginibacter sp.]
MKKLLIAVLFITACNFVKAQSVQYTEGDAKRASAYRGGLYIGAVWYLGRFKDSTAATFTARINGLKPTREGAIYYDSTSAREKAYLYRGDSAKTVELAMVITKSVTIDFASQDAQTSGDSTTTVTGASVGDPVSVSVGTAGVNLANSSFTAFVSAANTVTIRLNNYSASAKDPDSGVFRISVIKN